MKVAAGGRGGRGNAQFATATHQAPRRAEPGYPGETVELALILKLIADVGLVGLPNVGKSTLISRISSAKPKIADYPFTTLQPNLGIVRIDEYKNFVMADIPGLIEGAHLGKGLGTQFLRHIERTRIISYLIDPTTGPVQDSLAVLKSELQSYSVELLKKPYIIVLTKKDKWEEDYAAEAGKFLQESFIQISSWDGSGLSELKWRIWEQLEKIVQLQT